MFKRICILSALLASSAFVSGSASAADLIEEAPPMFSWSGFYIGAHVGGLWKNDDHQKSGCRAYKDIVGEHGGPPVFPSAEEIEIIHGNGYWEWPSGTDGSGCFDAHTDDGPGGVEDEEVEVRAFNLDGDFIAVLDDDHNNDDNNFNFLVGPQVGINQQYGGLVVGLEADWSWVGGGDNNNQTHEFWYFHSLDVDQNEGFDLENFDGVGRVSSGSDLDWIATFRGRLGMALGNEGRFLLYGTGGLALAGVSSHLRGSFDQSGKTVDWCEAREDVDCGFYGKNGDDHIQVGFAVGIGGEWAMTDSWSLGAEFLHLGFNDDNDKDKITFYGDDGRSFSFENNNSIDDVNLVRVKLNWRFPPG